MNLTIKEFDKLKASCESLRHKYKPGQTFKVVDAFNSLALYTKWAMYERDVYSWQELRRKIKPPTAMIAIIKERSVALYENSSSFIATYDVDFVFECCEKRGVIQSHNYPEETLDKFIDFSVETN